MEKRKYIAFYDIFFLNLEIDFFLNFRILFLIFAVIFDFLLFLLKKNIYIYIYIYIDSYDIYFII